MDLIAGLKRFENDEKLKKKIAFLVLELAKAFPDVNLKNEFAAAHAWLVITGSFKRDYARFLLNWIKRSQNRFNELKVTQGVTRPTKRYVEVLPAEEDIVDSDSWAKLKEELLRRKIVGG